MHRKKWYMWVALLAVGSMLLAACGAPEVVTVEVTRMVEGQTQVEQVVVTATPEPAEGEAPLAVISPEFKNPDTYVVITGAGEPETLDPAWTYETAGSTIEANIYEGLVWFNREQDRRVRPGPGHRLDDQARTA